MILRIRHIEQQCFIEVIHKILRIPKSNKSPKYLVVPAGKRASELTLTDKDFSEVSIFKKDIEIALNKSLVGINQEAALAGILANGYYVMGVKIEINTH